MYLRCLRINTLASGNNKDKILLLFLQDWCILAVCRYHTCTDSRTWRYTCFNSFCMFFVYTFINTLMLLIIADRCSVFALFACWFSYFCPATLLEMLGLKVLTANGRNQSVGIWKHTASWNRSTLTSVCCAFSGTAWCTAAAAGRAGEHYNEDVSKTPKLKYSGAAGLSVPLSSLCKQWASLSKSRWDLFLLRLSILLCLPSGLSARNDIFCTPQDVKAV